MKHTKKHFKQNAVERALTAPRGAATSCSNDKIAPFCDFLATNYGFTDITPVVGIACNSFLVANDGERPLFIKTGRHTGIYANEYHMGRALYEIDRTHFLEPLYYNDDGRFNFFANEYINAATLTTVMATKKLSQMQRRKLVRDLYQIFLALKQSDVVHRDIRPDNFVIHNGHLVLIDFQLAVSKRNYVELAYMRENPRRLRNLGGRDGFRYRRFVWDDAYSLLQVLRYIGRGREYGTEYDKIYREIRAHIGTDRIRSSVREGALQRLIRHIKETVKIG